MSLSVGAASAGVRSCLVTGGCGFIGSHLVDLLLSQGHRVCVVDDLSTGRIENLAQHAALQARGSLRVLTMDLASALRTELAQETFDEVYHLAAAVGVALVVADPIRCIHTNVHQTSELLEFVSKRKTPTLLASSSEVYGKGSKSPFAETDDVVYGSTDKPRWSYAASKAIDEYLGLAYHAQRNVPISIARFFNTVGPRQRGEYGMVVPRFVSAAMRGEPLQVYGDGEQSRCFCDARDVASALPRMLRASSCHGRVFNVGSDRSVTMNELAQLVLKLVGSPTVGIKHVPYEKVYGEAFEDLRVRRPDLTRIREAIGFAPSITLEQTILDIAREQREKMSAK
jgi:UDP-glucose 4-epimerase